MEARAHSVINSLSQAGWISEGNLNNLKQIYSAEIKSQDGEVLGRINPCFDLSKSLK